MDALWEVIGGTRWLQYRKNVATILLSVN